MRGATARTIVGALVLAGCFNPTGQTGEGSEGPLTTATTGTGEATMSTTTTTTIATTIPTEATPSTTTADVCGTCSPPTPYCLPTGQCGGCDELPAHDMSCGAIEAARPLCDPGSGACVECITGTDCPLAPICHPESKRCVSCVADDDCPEPLACDPELGECVGCSSNDHCPAPLQPICDLDSKRCRGCIEHGECPATACELDLGACFPDAAEQTLHHYVEASADVCFDGPCSLEMPCCEPATAVAAAAAASQTHHVIHVAAGTYKAPVAFGVDGRRVALLGGKGVTFEFDAAGESGFFVGDPALLGHVDAKLFLAAIEVAGGGTSVAFNCLDATTLWIDDARVLGHKGSSAQTQGCTLRLRRSTLVGNAGGVVASTGGIAELENTVLASIQPGAALEASTLGKIEVVYGTVIDKFVGLNNLLACDATATVTLRNSALFSESGTNTVACASPLLVVAHTATTAQEIADAGVTNATVAPAEAIELFVDWATDDYRLKSDGGVLNDLARWLPGDPLTDHDGLPRPAEPESLDVAGAYLPTP